MKRMKIKIQSKKEYESNLIDLVKNIDNKLPKKSGKKNGVYFESLKAVRKILTDNRLDVWRAIRDKKPDSITCLSKILGRGFRSVYRDVLLLEELGLIKLTEGPGERGHVMSLKSLYDELLLDIA